MRPNILIRMVKRVLSITLPSFVFPIYNLFREFFCKRIYVLTASVSPVYHNWGDDMSIQLCKLISPASTFVINKYTWNLFGRNDYLCIGSIITWMTTNKSIIWGSGIVYPDQELSYKPQKVLAVRGPLTRQYLLERGVDCPEVYGDPALLFPRFYQPKVEKKYRLGIIPHFRDKDNAIIRKYRQENNVLIIDVQKIRPWNKFIDDINCCDYIISSSLHGIIIADAYGIPNLWVEFDGGESKRFAFLDYFQSVHRSVDGPFTITLEESIVSLISHIKSHPISIDLEKLVSVCPFVQQ